jgi:hypothetical protein
VYTRGRKEGGATSCGKNNKKNFVVGVWGKIDTKKRRQKKK